MVWKDTHANYGSAHVIRQNDGFSSKKISTELHQTFSHKLLEIQMVEGLASETTPTPCAHVNPIVLVVMYK